MHKHKPFRSLLVALAAVALMMTVSARTPVFADEPASEVTTQCTEMTDPAEAAADAAPAEAEKSNPLLNGVLILAVIGAVFICVREIHRDNHRK